MNFVELRGLVLTATGWTVEQFNDAPLPAVFDLLEYWAEHPPEHVIAAAVAGIKPKDHKKKREKKMYEQKTNKKPVINPFNPEAEAQLPEFARKARQMERDRRLQESAGSK